MTMGTRGDRLEALGYRGSLPPFRRPLDLDRDVARVNAVVIYSRRAHAGRVLYLGRVGLRS